MRKADQEKKLAESFLYLKPKDTLDLTGRLTYKESLQAWNIIQLRKEVLAFFPQLKEKRGQFGYKMLYNSSVKELKKILDQLEEQDLVPILLLLGRIRD